MRQVMCIQYSEPHLQPVGHVAYNSNKVMNRGGQVRRSLCWCDAAPAAHFKNRLLNGARRKTKIRSAVRADFPVLSWLLGYCL